MKITVIASIQIDSNCFATHAEFMRQLMTVNRKICVELYYPHIIMFSRNIVDNVTSECHIIYHNQIKLCKNNIAAYALYNTII